MSDPILNGLLAFGSCLAVAIVALLAVGALSPRKAVRRG